MINEQKTSPATKMIYRHTYRLNVVFDIESDSISPSDALQEQLIGNEQYLFEYLHSNTPCNIYPSFTEHFDEFWNGIICLESECVNTEKKFNIKDFSF